MSLCFLTIIIMFIINQKVNTKDISTEDFTISYDTTWKPKINNNSVTLKHKKTKSEINIQTKILEDNYMDIKLKEIINDIIYGIEEQNSDYRLINIYDNPSDIYESYSYLYENDMEQTLVNIYKKDNKVVIAYFSANSEVFDILLDSVDNIFNSIEIKTGEKLA